MEEHRDGMAKDDMCKLPSLGEAPWLILTDEYNRPEPGRKQLFCLINNNKSYIKTIAELDGKSIQASNKGWLILREIVNRSRYSVWNPVTGQCLNLPELLDPPEGEPTFMFTSFPDGNAPCVVLLFKSLLFSCRPTKRGDCRWVKQSLVHKSRTVTRIVLAATLNEDIYVYAFMNNSGSSTVFAKIRVSDRASSSNMVFFDPLEIRFPCESIPTKSLRSDFLFEACGELYAVHILKRRWIANYDIVKIYVLRMDLSQMMWIQVKSLGNRAFLLGDNCCTWCWADTSCTGGIEGNCIYITSRGSETMHKYRLQNDSYIFLKPYSKVPRFFGSPIWFMPHKPTRLSPKKLIKRKSEDTIIKKHVEELDEIKMDEPTLSLICQLPLDMLISVTKYLHLFDYMNLRITCKMLRSNIPHPQWRSNCPYPLFMSLKNKKNSICELLDPCQNIRHTVVIPHSPDDLLSTIKFCKDGWLLLQTESHTLQCFNPFNRKSYRYPSYHINNNYVSCVAFSTFPTSPDCLTIGFLGYKWDRLIYFRAENGHWEYANIDVDSKTGIEFIRPGISSPRYHDEAFYILDLIGNLGVLKLLDGKWIWKVHKGPIPVHGTLLNYYRHSGQLAEIDGQLISVFIRGLGERVQVFKFDTLGNDWVALDDLGDYMLFLSPASSYSVTTKDKSMRNRIYLSKRFGNEIVFHSLTTGTYHTSSSQRRMTDDFCGMWSQSFSCWL